MPSQSPLLRSVCILKELPNIREVIEQTRLRPAGRQTYPRPRPRLFYSRAYCANAAVPNARQPGHTPWFISQRECRPDFKPSKP
jgi:hypothetical protein